MYQLRTGLSVLTLLIHTTNETITKTRTHSSKNSSICVSEDCVMVAATILGSLDRSVDPCDNFYQFACGGWMEKSIRAPADRFEVVDKRNQNLILQELERTAHSTSDTGPPKTAKAKAQAFYHSCMTSMDNYQASIQDLAAIIQYSGGWTATNDISSTENNNFSFDKRMQILQNELSVSVLFIRGLIRHEGRKRLAIVAGGWNKGLAEMTAKSVFDKINDNINFKEEYLQMMVEIVMELWKVAYIDNQISHPDTDNSLNTDDLNYQNDYLNINQTKEIEYEYEDVVLINTHSYPLVISDDHDYGANNSNNSNKSETVAFLVLNNETFSTENNSSPGFGEIFGQYYEKFMEWIRTLWSCVEGNQTHKR